MENFNKLVELTAVQGIDLPSGTYHFAVAYSDAYHLPDWVDRDSYLVGDGEHDAAVLNGLWVGLRPMDQGIAEHYGNQVILPYEMFQDLLAG
jgi:hypothetical protein